MLELEFSTAYADTYGTGPHLVLFIHGWSCQRSDWEDSISAILNTEFATAFQLIAVDLPGHGDNTATAWSDWSIAALGKWIADIVAHQNAELTTLIGHSMGGTVALEAARWIPNLTQVVLVDTFGLPYGDMDEATIASIEIPFQQNFVSSMHYLVDTTTASGIAPDTREWIKARMSSADASKMLPLWSDLLRWSPEAAFADISAPILAINGEHISDVAKARCAQKVRSTVLSGCHHFPQFEQPRLFNATLLHVLQKQI